MSKNDKFFIMFCDCFIIATIYFQTKEYVFGSIWLLCSLMFSIKGNKKDTSK